MLMVGRRVVCAISGGIDSAVSAYLLKQRGYDVAGLFMVNWDHSEEGVSNCPRSKDLADAQKVCKILEIELHEVNFVKEYWNNVFEPFIENYKRGRAVVPDVGCNSFIKFGLLYDYSFDKLQASAVATGHYARNSFGDFLELAHDGSPKLLRAKDPLKDQTYFLSNIPRDCMENTMFPVGSMYKSEVFKCAVEANLSFLLNKKESMGICFVGKRQNFSEFLNQYVEPVPGSIYLSSNGQKIGEHNGIHNFTLGKRISVPLQQYHSHEGLFVSKLDYQSQAVYVCEGSYHPVLFAKSFQLEEPSWTRKPSENVLFALQRNQPLLQARLEGDIVIPSRPVRAAATGQMCVIYEGDVCIGGAEIKQITETL